MSKVYFLFTSNVVFAGKVHVYVPEANVNTTVFAE
jgi:hypothetical protein